MNSKSDEKPIKPNFKNIKQHPSYTKWMMQALIFSVAINVALLTSMLFNALSHKSSSKASFVKKIAASNQELPALEQLLVELSEKEYSELVTLLKKEQHVEDGFSYRDLAISVLAHQHDVDVERALLGQPVNYRYISIPGAAGKTYDYPVLSSLSAQQFSLIETFMTSEQWPLTSQGLFKRLAHNSQSESLRNAFYLTKEFMFLDGLFCSLSISKEVLLDIMLSGDWSQLHEFIHTHHQPQEFSNALRIQFLSQYLSSGSGLAARLILEIDATYALKKLEDAKIVALLGLLEDKSNLAENFAIHLALGNRSDWVRQEAARLLYFYNQLSLPEPYQHSQAVGFIAERYQIDPVQAFASVAQSLPEAAEAIAQDTHDIYVVQEGDNLWKIAKKNQVKVDDLREVNQLQSDLIKVGMKLKLP